MHESIVESVEKGAIFTTYKTGNIVLPESASGLMGWTPKMKSLCWMSSSTTRDWWGRSMRDSRDSLPSLQKSH